MLSFLAEGRQKVFGSFFGSPDKILILRMSGHLCYSSQSAENHKRNMNTLEKCNFSMENSQLNSNASP